MNPSPPPLPGGPDPEARLTAMLLGELSPEETAALRAEISRDPELARLESRLRQAIQVLRAALGRPAATHASTSTATPATSAQPVVKPQLSAARRHVLQTAFKVIPARPRPAPAQARLPLIWGISLRIAAMLILLLGAAVVLAPMMSRAKTKGYHSAAVLSRDTAATADRRETRANADQVESKAITRGTESLTRRGRARVELQETAPTPVVPSAQTETALGRRAYLAGGGLGGGAGGGGGFGGAPVGGSSKRVEIVLPSTETGAAGADDGSQRELVRADLAAPVALPADRSSVSYGLAVNGPAVDELARKELADKVPVLGDAPSAGALFMKERYAAAPGAESPPPAAAPASSAAPEVGQQLARYARVQETPPAPAAQASAGGVISVDAVGYVHTSVDGVADRTGTKENLNRPGLATTWQDYDNNGLVDQLAAGNAPQSSMGGGRYAAGATPAPAQQTQFGNLVVNGAADTERVPALQSAAGVGDALSLNRGYGTFSAGQSAGREQAGIALDFAGKDAVVSRDLSVPSVSSVLAAAPEPALAGAFETAARPATPPANRLASGESVEELGEQLQRVPAESLHFDAGTAKGITTTAGKPVTEGAPIMLGVEFKSTEATNDQTWPIALGSRGLYDDARLAKTDTTTQAGRLVQEGRELYENGRLAEAETKFKEAVDADPSSQAGYYFRQLVDESRAAGASRKAAEKDIALLTTTPGTKTHAASMPEAKLKRRAELERDLASLQQVRDTIRQRTLQEQTDSAVPKSSIVSITDPAEAKPAETPSLGTRIKTALSGQVERSARIAVEKDVSDVAVLGRDFGQSPPAFDPYFIQTEVEKLKSKSVLYPVIDQLNLNKTWAAKVGRTDTLDRNQTLQLLQDRLDIRTDGKSSLLEIRAKSDNPEEAAQLANAVADSYQKYRLTQKREMMSAGVKTLQEELTKQEDKVRQVQSELEALNKEVAAEAVAPSEPAPPPKPATPPPTPQPETAVTDNPFSTFSLNVSDVSFKLAGASLEGGQLPDPGAIRSEEFINAFNYRDPEVPAGWRVGFNWDRARYPFAHNRDLLRFAVKTAARGREPGRPLNLVLCLDSSGSMERADRTQIIREALKVLAAQLKPEDRISVVAFARTARLWADAVPGDQAADLADRVGTLTPEGGTNLEDALRIAYETAARHYQANGANRVVLLTDGAANLGDVNPESLKQAVETRRKQGIALDCFGIGWEGYNDDLLEALARNGDGRYGFVNAPEEAATEFAGQLAGALQVAANDVKVQAEFNPRRVVNYRQIGYAKHQLTKEQFRDNTVDAAELGAAEAGNALYVIETDPRGTGPIGYVRARYKVPATGLYEEHEWLVPYQGPAPALELSNPAMRLAASASAFSEWLAQSPYAGEVTPDALLNLLRGVPEVFHPDPRPTRLEWMVRQAKSVSGR